MGRRDGKGEGSVCKEKQKGGNDKSFGGVSGRAQLGERKLGLHQRGEKDLGFIQGEEQNEGEQKTGRTWEKKWDPYQSREGFCDAFICRRKENRKRKNLHTIRGQAIWGSP